MGSSKHNNRYSDEEIIFRLQEFYREYGISPSRIKHWRGRLPSASNIEKRFGSWNNALNAAGLLTRTSSSPSISCLCSQCETPISVYHHIWKKSKTKRFFCSSSCAATYNNQHKTYGIRRSKLEKYIEEQLIRDYPDVKFMFNNKTVIGSELDIYSPSLKIAIEINGILHYRPIYGVCKFKKIQNSDKEKISKCNDKGIKFFVIDISDVGRVTKKSQNKYYGIVREIINSGRQEEIRTLKH